MEETTEAPQLTEEERGKLKKISRKPKPGGGMTEPAKESRVSDVFPAEKVYSIDGVDYRIGPLTFADQRAIEDEYFNLQDFLVHLSAEHITAYLFLVWLSFRKQNPSLKLEGMLSFALRNSLKLEELATEAFALMGLVSEDPNPKGSNPATETDPTGK